MLDRETVERAAGGERNVLIALSGGGDSVALLHLLVESLGASRVRAAVVDHGLREGARADAERAVAFAAAVGVAAKLISLRWESGQGRGQRRAREARYRALCAAAGEAGARAMFTGHTADDQAETVLMRAARGSSWRGLAGIAPLAAAPVWPEGLGIVLARPLLSARRTALRDLLRKRGAAWVEDPANANPAFARVCARRALGQMGREGFDSMRLTQLASRLRRYAERLDAAALALVEHAARFAADHVIVDQGGWGGDGEVRRRALSVLVTAAAGAEREPSAAAVARLEARLSETTFRGASLGGARLAVRRGSVWIGRDPGALLGRAGIAPLAALELSVDASAIWDGRALVSAAAEGWSVVATPRGPKFKKGRTFAPFEASATHRLDWLLERRVRTLLAPWAA